MKSCIADSPTVGTPAPNAQAFRSSDGLGVFVSSAPCDSPGPLLEPGMRMERFTIIRHLGSGRGAHVYLAHDDQRAHEVALKVADLRPDTASWVEARMRREIDLRRRVGSHPHILTLFDTHRVRLGGLDLIVLSMEHADGGDFRQWLGQTQNDPATRIEKGVKYLLEGARGVLALHRVGVVHLDVKPENLFCVQGVWKIGDLDHAQSIEELQGRGLQDNLERGSVGVLGTLGYGSPEMYEPGGAYVDTRADIFSLGVVLRETLRIAEHLSPRREHTGQGAGRPFLARVLGRCLKANPNERFQLVDHVIELLETGHRPPTDGPQAVQWPDDDRRWRQARRCLAEGRARDARRLCTALLENCAHHPGARAVMVEMDRREHQTLETARQLIADPRAAVTDAIGDLREIVDLLPNHEETDQLVGTAEQRLTACYGALVDALTCLSSGNLTGFAEALDRASEWNPHDSTTVDACVRARDLVQMCIGSRTKIAEAVTHRQYRRALCLIRRHKHLLSKVATRSGSILASLENPTATTPRRSS